MIVIMHFSTPPHTKTHALTITTRVLKFGFTCLKCSDLNMKPTLTLMQLLFTDTNLHWCVLSWTLQHKCDGSYFHVHYTDVRVNNAPPHINNVPSSHVNNVPPVNNVLPNE